jgi:hypothetical protein
MAIHPRNTGQVYLYLYRYTRDFDHQCLRINQEQRMPMRYSSHCHRHPRYYVIQRIDASINGDHCLAKYLYNHHVIKRVALHDVTKSKTRMDADSQPKSCPNSVSSHLNNVRKYRFWLISVAQRNKNPFNPGTQVHRQVPHRIRRRRKRIYHFGIMRKQSISLYILYQELC